MLGVDVLLVRRGSLSAWTSLTSERGVWELTEVALPRRV